MSKTSLHDVDIRKQIERTPGVSFYGILLALIARADTDNLARLRQAFPEVVREFKIRYHSPAGTLNMEEWIERYGEKEKSPGEHDVLVAMFRRAQRIADNE